MCLVLAACSGEPTIVRALPDIRFITVDGQPLGPAQYRGRPVLINIWSTTCGVCLREMPLLQAVYEKRSQEGLVLVALSMPYDRPSDALELQQTRGWGFPVAIDPQGHAIQALGRIDAVPTTVLFDAQGQRVWMHTGELQADSLNRALASVLPARL